MNLSQSFEKIKTKQYQLTARQRLMVIVAIGMMAIIIVIYATTSEVAVEPVLPGNTSQPVANAANKSGIAVGNQVIPINQVNQTMRDPFAKPPEAKDQINDADGGLPVIQNNIPSNVRSNVPAMVPRQVGVSKPQDSLRLTGIVGNAERRLAVIMSANKSQSYSLNDVIGTYTLVAINDDSVVLTNTTGRLVLRFDSAGQKGGL